MVLPKPSLSPNSSVYHVFACLKQLSVRGLGLIGIDLRVCSTVGSRPLSRHHHATYVSCSAHSYHKDIDGKVSLNQRARVPCHYSRHTPGIRALSTKAGQGTHHPSPLHSPPFRVCFFGTDDMSLPTLQALHKELKGHQDQVDSSVSKLHVICPEDKPRGRGHRVRAGPVHSYCLQHGVPCITVPKQVPMKMTGFELPFTPNDYDIAVVVSFGYFIPSRILDYFPSGSMNVHPSLLPKYRGAAPIQHALLNGDTETGVSIIELHRDRFDAGRLLLQQSYPLTGTETMSGLLPNLAQVGAALVVQALRDYPATLAHSRLQGNDGVSHAPKLKAELGHVDWTQDTAVSIYNRWRALHGGHGTHTHFAGRAIQLLRLDLAPLPPMLQGVAQPGIMMYNKKDQALYVTTIDSVSTDTGVRVHDVLVPSKRPGPVVNFVNGYTDLPALQKRINAGKDTVSVLPHFDSPSGHDREAK